MKNYGLIFDKNKDPNAYVLGGFTSLPKIVLQPDGQWDAYLPEVERQNAIFETWNCTSYATNAVFEMLLRRLGSTLGDRSDRALALKAKTKPPGNDPHVVAQAAHDYGLVAETSLPYKNLNNVDEYYSYKGGVEYQCDLEGQDFLMKYDVGHEYVINGGASKEERTKRMKEALQYSPLGVSVTAWNQTNGVYVDGGQPNNHWTAVYGWNDQGWKCFDSYDSTLKILSYDHKIEVVKRYLLSPSTRKERLSMLAKILELLAQLLGLVQKSQPAPVVPVEPQQPPKEPTRREKILAEARLWLGQDASPLDLAPSERACAEAVSYLLRRCGYGVPQLVSTIDLFNWLKKSPDFKITTEQKPGNLIISYTGSGNGSIIGHVGIFSEKNIMSNDSATGLWLENYSLTGWVRRWRTLGGMPIIFFEAVDK